MTIGIYKLAFNSTEKVYIGQSGCIEKRYINHISNMKAGASSHKLQEAYNLYGEPYLEQLVECPLAELNKLEEDYILKYNAIANGFNRVPGGSNSNYGIYNSNSKYTIEDYHEVLVYLAETNMSYADIMEITGITGSVIMHISSLTRHFWLSEAYPELYSKLEAKRAIGTRRSIGNTTKALPILSPTGKEFSVTNITKFAKEHGLSSGSLSTLLAGKSNSCKGWTLPGTTLIAHEVKSPDGIIYRIPYRGISPFAIKHGLTTTSLHELVSKKLKIHKGWTLCE